jgi:ketoreductase RED2
MSKLTNQVAIVTGSTSGIGEGIARMLSKAGVRVVINSVSSKEKGEKLAEELGHAIYVQGDLGNEQDCKHLIGETVKAFGQIDILVNNAGKPFGLSQDVLGLSNEDFSKTLDVNVVGAWCLIREAIPYLKKSGDGNVVNITSCAGMDPASAASGIAYSIAKAAINYLTKLLAKECGPEVRVNAVAPGLTMTPRTSGSEDFVNHFIPKIPVKHAGTPEDIAEFVLAIIKSNFINGEIILVDGGFAVV